MADTPLVSPTRPRRPRAGAIGGAPPGGSEPYPFHGRIFKDFDTGRAETVFTDVITGERVLRPGLWHLEFDADGSGCIAAENSDEVVFLEDVFSQKLFVTGDGRIVLMSERGEASDLHLENRRYCEGIASFAKDSRRGELQLTAYALCRHRAGFRVWWSLTSAYKTLGLKSFKGFPSKWVYESMGSWVAAMGQISLEGHMMLSTGGLSIEDSLKSPDRFLPSGSASSLGLLWLMTRCALLPCRLGGLRDDEDRAAARRLLKALLLACPREGEVWKVRVAFDDEWQNKWPRPTFDSAMCVDLEVNANGELDVCAWREQVEAAVVDRGHPLRSWWQGISQAIPSSGIVPLENLLDQALRKKQLAPLARQLLWSVGLRLDAQVLADDAANESLGWVAASQEGLRGRSREVDLQLARYLASSQNMFKAPAFLSLATDKASVKGLSLVNTVMVDSNNRAALLPPQVGLVPPWEGSFRLAASPRGSWCSAVPGSRKPRQDFVRLVYNLFVLLVYRCSPRYYSGPQTVFRCINNSSFLYTNPAGSGRQALGVTEAQGVVWCVGLMYVAPDCHFRLLVPSTQPSGTTTSPSRRCVSSRASVTRIG